MQGRNGKPEGTFGRSSRPTHLRQPGSSVNNPVVALHRARPTTVVAIPVRDEAERITACLTALDRQDRLPDMVLLLLNNCTDTTEAIARVLARSFRFDLKLICRELPPAQANAGCARRIAMASAARVA